MKAQSEQFVTDGRGNPVAVMINMKRYKAMMDEMDELESIRAYDEAKKSRGKPIPLERALKAIEKGRKR